LLINACYRSRPQKLTFDQWEAAAGNHAFDDHPEAFGISENEGHHIRSMFQSASFNKEDLIQQLHGWGVIDFDFVGNEFDFDLDKGVTVDPKDLQVTDEYIDKVRKGEVDE